MMDVGSAVWSSADNRRIDLGPLWLRPGRIFAPRLDKKTWRSYNTDDKYTWHVLLLETWRKPYDTRRNIGKKQNREPES